MSAGAGHLMYLVCMNHTYFTSRGHHGNSRPTSLVRPEDTYLPVPCDLARREDFSPGLVSDDVRPVLDWLQRDCRSFHPLVPAADS